MLFKDEMDLSTVLRNFQSANVDNTSQLVVIARRRKILHSANVALSKPLFQWQKTPNVEFIGEMAEDYGGPRREFFR